MSWNKGQVLQIPVGDTEGDVRLDRWLKRRFPGLTQGQVEKLLRKGEVRVDGSRAKSSTRLEPGQVVRVPPMPSTDQGKKHPQKEEEVYVSPRDAELIQSLILYEDEDVYVLNKPSGLAVQGGTKTLRHVDGMANALTRPGQDKPRLVHRLDKDTSGLLVLAKTAQSAAEMSKHFRSRELDKIYWAVVKGVPNPNEGELRGWMMKAHGPGQDKELMTAGVHGQKGAVFAITDFKVVSTAGQRASWVALKPSTGRKHQLRYHMSEIGNSILGDAKYTCDRETPAGLPPGLHLHARALRMPRRRGSDVEVIAPLPEHMKKTFDFFGFSEDEAGNPFDTIQPMGRRR
ncbi:RluA family pseudouridine synthase [Hirschia baltica]|uniref:Pseudouridine synthase, RluA family n=1 Tax=Hirschia baltica (strain ATCC 49814 / DSM 5838 / IFAM 1418) TaxID=582402 RepID=C6XLD6_HIRBI|nr:RluA family pseudouridine synthase [Hirschia baltica]ACT59735.1 pseudouridine synthase, RluA family [Hirschia baltica ATCC 49814]